MVVRLVLEKPCISILGSLVFISTQSPHNYNVQCLIYIYIADTTLTVSHTADVLLPLLPELTVTRLVRLLHTVPVYTCMCANTHTVYIEHALEYTYWSSIDFNVPSMLHCQFMSIQFGEPTVGGSTGAMQQLVSLSSLTSRSRVRYDTRH